MRDTFNLRPIIELLLVTLILQIGVFSFIFSDGWVPQVSVLFVLFLGFYQPSVLSAISVFALGVLVDMSAGSMLGPSSASLLVTHLLVGYSSKRLFLESPIAAVIFGAGCAALAGAVRYVLLSQFVPHDFLIPLLKESFTTALCAPIMLIIFRARLGRKKGI